jgi:hypothetical protein
MTTVTRRVRFSNPRKLVTPVEPIIWHETGGWSVWNDNTEGFPSRKFVKAVAAQPRKAAA